MNMLLIVLRTIQKLFMLNPNIPSNYMLLCLFSMYQRFILSICMIITWPIKRRSILVPLRENSIDNDVLEYYHAFKGAFHMRNWVNKFFVVFLSFHANYYFMSHLLNWMQYHWKMFSYRSDNSYAKQIYCHHGLSDFTHSRVKFQTSWH